MSSHPTSNYFKMMRKRIILKRFGRTVTGIRLQLNGKSTKLSPVSTARRKPEIKPGVYDKPAHRNEVVNSFWKTGTCCWNTSLTNVIVLTRCSIILQFTNWNAQVRPSNLLTNYPSKPEASRQRSSVSWADGSSFTDLGFPPFAVHTCVHRNTSCSLPNRSIALRPLQKGDRGIYSGEGTWYYHRTSRGMFVATILEWFTIELNGNF